MLKQMFQTEDLRDALERALGFRLKSFSRVGGGGAVNFKGERESDGRAFLVKCYPPERRREHEILSATVRAMKGVMSPVRLYEETCPQEFAGHRLICFAWQTGSFVSLCQLTEDQWKMFLDDYMALSERMQAVNPRGPVRPLKDWWSVAQGQCRGLSGRMLRSALEVMQEEDLMFKPERARTIHGDFHQGNVLFVDGKVKCFMDFEDFRIGYPAEDIAYYCIVAAKKCGGSDRAAFQKILSLFQEAVRYLPYAPQEWRTALNALFLMRLRRQTDGFRRLGPFAALKMAKRARLFGRFRRLIDASVNEV